MDEKVVAVEAAVVKMAEVEVEGLSAATKWKIPTVVAVGGTVVDLAVIGAPVIVVASGAVISTTPSWAMGEVSVVFEVDTMKILESSVVGFERAISGLEKSPAAVRNESVWATDISVMVEVLDGIVMTDVTWLVKNGSIKVVSDNPLEFSGSGTATGCGKWVETEFASRVVSGMTVLKFELTATASWTAPEVSWYELVGWT